MKSHSRQQRLPSRVLFATLLVCLTCNGSCRVTERDELVGGRTVALARDFKAQATPGHVIVHRRSGLAEVIGEDSDLVHQTNGDDKTHLQSSSPRSYLITEADAKAAKPLDLWGVGRDPTRVLSSSSQGQRGQRSAGNDHTLRKEEAQSVGDVGDEETGSYLKPFGPTRSHKFDLTDFGAKGDGTTDNTRAIQNAIYAVSTVSEKGGGQLYVPPGKFLTGSFNLTSRMTLFLSKNASLVAIPNSTLWPLLPPLPSYGRGREMPGPRHSSLIYGHNLSDVIITGEGIIDGQGETWWEWHRSKKLNYSRGPLIELVSSKDVAVANITILDSPYWAVHPVYCVGVLVGNLVIIAPDDSPDTGGIYPDSCTDVLIEDCMVRTGGDCISIKSGWDEYGIAYNRSCSQVTVRGCQLQCTNCTALSVGSEMSGGVDQILFEDIEIRETHAGFRLKTAPGRGGFVTGLRLKNVSMDDVDVAFSFMPMYGEHADDKYDPQALPVVRDITFEEVTGTLIGTAGVLEGLPLAPFKKINVTHVHLDLVEGGHGFSCIAIEDVKAKDVVPILPKMCKAHQSIRIRGGRSTA